MKLERVTCLIDRAAHLKIEKTVPSWEVRVLKALFGDANVAIVRTESGDSEGDFDARKEWDSMFNRYKSAQDENAESVFLKVYPSVDSLEIAIERTQERAKRKTSEARASA